MSSQLSYRLLLAGLFLATGLLFFLSLTVGPAGFGFAESLQGVFSGQGDSIALIMREIRLPRALLGLMVGMTLGLSGAVLQGYLRNPLAEPGLIGVTASASLGAVLAIYTGFASVFPLGLPLAALAAAVAAVIVVQLLAGAFGGVLTVILAGVAVSSFATAMTSLALNLSPNPYAALEIMFWMLGSLADRSMDHVLLAAPAMLVGWLMLFGLGRSLDALTLGRDTAASMGVDLKRLQLLVVFGTAAAVGGATSVTGAIGFVGLVVPHVLRPLTGSLPSRLLPASALGGGALVLAADILVRLIAPERDLKLGVVTAVVGAPFFLWLVWRTRRQML
ncbi:iron ABC transporter permease [Neorhizobium sp. T786]|uniref:FecCD family ABC transporter permease n=1 Tax=Pseudorhizobium xiangyangii TaxID=2883104 RepID=UPI001CFF9AB6|nr:iron ABC transporter permease [Neorhizobium xiangyangii]MCB5204040.1 iron ABC transporter permease [Neorhizobium xiangyangii]